MANKVAIASCYNTFNFGSMLQSYATEKAIKDMGFDAITLNRAGLTGDIGKKRYPYLAKRMLDTAFVTSKGGLIRHRIKRLLDPAFKANMEERYQAFGRFEKTHFTLSPYLGGFRALSGYCWGMDSVVVGSDQLWSPLNIIGDYYTLNFVPKGVRRVSFATSFGVKELPQDCTEQATQFLQKLDYISVREDDGAALIKKLSGRDAHVVCDPAMLLTAQQWQEIADEAKQWRQLSQAQGKLPSKPYIFCYFLGNNTWHRECVRWLSRESGYEVVAINHCDDYVAGDDQDFADYTPYDVGPAEWLSLLSQAAYVFTDSYHASVFSALFHRDFYTFRRHSSSDKYSTNSRLDTLLGRLNVKQRLCQSPSDFFDCVAAPIDWTSAEKAIQDYRNYSADWLKRSLTVEETPMIKIVNKALCCGCTACAHICPENCITMVRDAEGCEYPSVDEEACIQCGKCKSVCPVLNVAPEEAHPQRAFLVQHNDNEILADSTSGGAFTALAQGVIEEGGIVFGAALIHTSNGGGLEVQHIGVETEDQLFRFRNSKYVQSNTAQSYREVKEELEKKRKVLYSGTPCQIEGLVRFLGRRYENLCMADFVCHAVPCRAVFRAYCVWLDENNSTTVTKVRFRDKRKYGYHYSQIRAYNEDGTDSFYSAGVESDPYLRAFFSDMSDRPSCYACPFKKRYRVSDVTLWDCFDVEKFGKEFNDNRGVTRVLVHTQEGQRLLDDASSRAKIREIDVEKAVYGAREMVAPVGLSPKREPFMQSIVEEGSKAFDRWLPDTLLVKIERRSRVTAEKFGIYDQAKKIAKRILRK